MIFNMNGGGGGNQIFNFDNMQELAAYSFSFAVKPYSSGSSYNNQSVRYLNINFIQSQDYLAMSEFVYYVPTKIVLTSGDVLLNNKTVSPSESNPITLYFEYGTKNPSKSGNIAIESIYDMTFRIVDGYSSSNKDCMQMYLYLKYFSGDCLYYQSDNMPKGTLYYKELKLASGIIE